MTMMRIALTLAAALSVPLAPAAQPAKRAMTEPNHQVDRIQRIADWFDRFLK